MKKTLIALAVLAASGAAMAQSSVTLYGVLDLSYGKLKGGKWGMNNGDAGYGGSVDGFHTPSRIGFKGTEDLGGGLKANFGLETGGLDMTGAGTTLAFGREAFISLSGNSWGEVRLGRTSSIAAKTMLPFDINAVSYSSAVDHAGLSPVTWYGSSRRNSQLQYLSPNFGGVTVRAGFTAKGDEGGSQGVGVPATAKNRYSLGVSYANGPVSVGVVGETKATDANRTAYSVGVGYDLNVVKLTASYGRRESKGVLNSNTFSNEVTGATTGSRYTGGKGWTIGAAAPLGAATVGVQYGRNTEAHIKAFEVFANYALSKRTTLYADFGKGSSMDAVAAGGARVAAPANPYAVGLGVIHTF